MLSSSEKSDNEKTKTSGEEELAKIVSVSRIKSVTLKPKVGECQTPEASLFGEIVHAKESDTLNKKSESQQDEGSKSLEAEEPTVKK